MVAQADDGHGCDPNGGGGFCPSCEFKRRLADVIEDAAEGHERYWDDFQGELVDKLHELIWALHRARRERFTDDHDDIANAWEAATRVVEVFEALHELRDDVLGATDDDESD